MLVSLAVGERVACHKLESEDCAAVDRLARDLVTVAGGRVDDPDWVRAARRCAGDLPGGLAHRLSDFRRASGDAGAMLLHNLPVAPGEMPETPMVAGSVQRVATVPAGVLMMIATALGDPVAYHAEKSGALVQNVVPVPGRENTQANTGSVQLELHTENAFHPYRPDFVVLLCLRADHDRVAGLCTVSIRRVLSGMDPAAREALSAPEFVTAPPPSFCVGVPDEPHAVLAGAPDDPDLRIDFHATAPLTARARTALDGLRAMLAQAAVTLRLRPGDLAIVDNRVAVHGRTSFRPRYDGTDRWLQRTFVVTDIRRSRALRPGDGYVLVG